MSTAERQFRRTPRDCVDPLQADMRNCEQINRLGCEAENPLGSVYSLFGIRKNRERQRRGRAFRSPDQRAITRSFLICVISVYQR